MEIVTDREIQKYTAIVEEPNTPRPEGFFSEGQYTACNTKKGWEAGRLIEVSQGMLPEVLTICLSQGKSLCGKDTCESWCPDRYLTLADSGGVVGLKDLENILLDPEPLEAANLSHGLVDYTKAGVLLQLIIGLKKKQARGC